jgi:hypothetical protein
VAFSEIISRELIAVENAQSHGASLYCSGGRLRGPRYYTAKS